METKSVIENLPRERYVGKVRVGVTVRSVSDTLRRRYRHWPERTRRPRSDIRRSPRHRFELRGEVDGALWGFGHGQYGNSELETAGRADLGRLRHHVAGEKRLVLLDGAFHEMLELTDRWLLIGKAHSSWSNGRA